MNTLQTLLIIPVMVLGYLYFSLITAVWCDYVKIKNEGINSLLYLIAIFISTIPYIYLLKLIY